jgi:hypothetical protein
LSIHVNGRSLPNFYSFSIPHSFSCHNLNFSHSSHSLEFRGPSSPALSQLQHGEATLSHTFGVTGN